MQQQRGAVIPIRKTPFRHLEITNFLTGKFLRSPNELYKNPLRGHYVWTFFPRSEEEEEMFEKGVVEVKAFLNEFDVKCSFVSLAPAESLSVSGKIFEVNIII